MTELESGLTGRLAMAEIALLCIVKTLTSKPTGPERDRELLKAATLGALLFTSERQESEVWPEEIEVQDGAA